MEYLLSVDGGGTKTEFSVSKIDGTNMKSYVTGSTNFKSVGEEVCFLNFQRGMQWIKEELKIALSDIAYGVFGISGCDSPNDYAKLHQQIIRLGLAEKQFYLCNDGVLAYYAQVDAPGIVVISGTGSIVMGIGKDARIERAGGWGYNISDVGSGQWIGNEAIKETLLYCDGCRPFSKLYESVNHFLCEGEKEESLEQFPYIVTDMQDYNKIAKTAIIVLQLAAQGNQEAVAILHRGAVGLAELSKSVFEKCGFKYEPSIHFVFSGGVIGSEFYQQLLIEELKKRIPMEKITCVVQKNQPVMGGIRLAMKKTEDRKNE